MPSGSGDGREVMRRDETRESTACMCAEILDASRPP